MNHHSMLYVDPIKRFKCFGKDLKSKVRFRGQLTINSERPVSHFRVVSTKFPLNFSDIFQKSQKSKKRAKNSEFKIHRSEARSTSFKPASESMMSDQNDFFVTIYERKSDEYHTICDLETFSVISDFLEKKKTKARVPRVRISKTESDNSVQPNKMELSDKVIKSNITKHLDDKRRSRPRSSEMNQQLLIPGSRGKKLSFKNQNPTTESLKLISKSKLDQINLENFTKKRKTEEVENNMLGSMGEIDVINHFAKEQKTESYNIFHDSASLPKSKSRLDSNAQRASIRRASGR